MARTKSQRADEDALDPVEAADVEHADDADAGLLELDPEAELDDEDDEDADEDDEVDTDASDDDGDDAPGDPAALDTDANETDEHDVVGVVVLPDAAFDDDDEVVAAVIDDDDDDEIEGVRDGEFVCRRCYMAMRETQLADAERLLCRDCA